MRASSPSSTPTVAGFPLHVYLLVTIQRHDDAAHRKFTEAVQGMPEVISADWVTGEIDAILVVVAREVAELQRVIVRLSTRGGAVRVTTLLRLEELKRALRLPLETAARRPSGDWHAELIGVGIA